MAEKLEIEIREGGGGGTGSAGSPGPSVGGRGGGGPTGGGGTGSGSSAGSPGPSINAPTPRIPGSQPTQQQVLQQLLSRFGGESGNIAANFMGGMQGLFGGGGPAVGAGPAQAAKMAGAASSASTAGAAAGSAGQAASGVAAGTGGTAAGASGALAAAGPIGMIVMAIQAAKEKIEKEMQEKVKAVGAVASGIASLEPAAVAEGFKNLAEQVPLVGKALGESVNQIMVFSRTMDATIHRLSSYNGELAKSVAMAEVANIQGDIRRAEMLGPDLSKFQDKQSEVEQEIRDMLAELLKDGMPIILTNLEMVSTFVKGNMKLYELVKGLAEAIAENAQHWNPLEWQNNWKRISDVFKRIADNTEKEKKPTSQFLQDILTTIMSGGGFGGRGAPRAPRVLPVGPNQARPFQV